MKYAFLLIATAVSFGANAKNLSCKAKDPSNPVGDVRVQATIQSGTELAKLTVALNPDDDALATVDSIEKDKTYRPTQKNKNFIRFSFSSDNNENSLDLLLPKNFADQDGEFLGKLMFGASDGGATILLNCDNR